MEEWADMDALRTVTRVCLTADDVLALLDLVDELENNNAALSWLLSECGEEIPFRLPDAMEQLRARVVELEAQLIAAQATTITWVDGNRTVTRQA